MTMYFDYSKFTLEEIDTYFNTDFECDGEHKRIKVIIRKENK